MRLILSLFPIILISLRAYYCMNLDGDILDFRTESLHSRNGMVLSGLSSTKTLATKSRLHEQYYYASSYEAGFVLMQYYSGSRCNGSMTINYGYRNGACVPDGASGSTRIYFENNDCATTTAIVYNDNNCQVPAYSYLLGALTLCQTNSSQADSYTWSYNLHCFSGPNLPITMDSVLYSYRAGYSTNQTNSQVCAEEILAFQSVSTGLCLSTPTKDASYNLSCSTLSNKFTLYNFLNDDSCSSLAVVNTYEATCPANSGINNESDEIVMQRQLTMHNNGRHNEHIQSAANNWWIIADTYSKSNTNSATTNAVILYLYTCAGATYTIGTCDYTFTGNPFLALYLNNVLLTTNDDYCGLGSQMTYTPAACGTYQVNQGCYQQTSCSATTTLSAPVGPIVCPYFYSSSASVACQLYACTGTTIISTCSSKGANVNGNVLLSLTLNGNVVATGVSDCGGAGVTITYHVTSCATYQINQYCSGNTGSTNDTAVCFGNIGVNIIQDPTAIPTATPTYIPTQQPSSQPSSQPSRLPSCQPSSRPTMQPSCKPSSMPSHQPTNQPSNQPSTQPSTQPSSVPYSQPSMHPSMQPSIQPSSQPSMQPSGQPSSHPSVQPSQQPSSRPSMQPSAQPSRQPSSQPSDVPSMQPSSQPSCQPTSLPTMQPSQQPSSQPSRQPSSTPSMQPSQQPSVRPSMQPSSIPSMQPSLQPTSKPSMQPSIQPTIQPSSLPSGQPSTQPTNQPTSQPSLPDIFLNSIYQTTECVIQNVTLPVYYPPTAAPSAQPSNQPSSQPSNQPSTQPSTQPTYLPTNQPSNQPTSQPSAQPSVQPSMQPSTQPSSLPTMQPSRQPSSQPSTQPITQPSIQPASKPSVQPSSQPSNQPSIQPSPSIGVTPLPTIPTSDPSPRPVSSVPTITPPLTFPPSLSPTSSTNSVSVAPSLSTNSSSQSTGSNNSTQSRLASSAMMGIVGAVVAVTVLVALGCCYRQGWILSGGRSSSSDEENSSQSSASSAAKENPLHTAVRSKTNPLYRKNEQQLDSPAEIPRPTYKSRFNRSNNKRLRSHGIFQRNNKSESKNEVEMSDIETSGGDGNNNDNNDDELSRKSNFLSSTVVANSLALSRRRPLGQQRSGLENKSAGPQPVSLRSVPKRENKDVNLYPDDSDVDEAKLDLQRVSYSQYSGKMEDGGGMLSLDDDFDFRRVKNKWKNQEDTATAAGMAAAPPPPSAVQRFLPWVTTTMKKPAVVVAPPPAIHSTLTSQLSKKDEGFSGSNPLARRPAAKKTRNTNIDAVAGVDRMEDIAL